MSKIGFLFPGQGAQFIGMGKELYETFPIAKEIFEKANDLLEINLSKICFEGPEEELTRTLYAQPAIYVTSIAALEVLKSNIENFTPDFVAGLSLGEFTALCSAGSFSYEDGLKLVWQRATAMEKAAQNNPGTMASIIGLDEAGCFEVAELSGCEVANLNSPQQTVLSGTVETIEKSCGIAKEKGAKRAIPLTVGGAFHSSLMAEAKEDLLKALESTSINEPQATFIPNATGEITSDAIEIKKLLGEQLISSVHWTKTMRTAADAGIQHFIEIGPGKVLKGLAKKCNSELQVTPFGHPDDLPLVEKFLNEELQNASR